MREGSHDAYTGHTSYDHAHSAASREAGGGKVGGKVGRQGVGVKERGKVGRQDVGKLGVILLLSLGLG